MCGLCRQDTRAAPGQAIDGNDETKALTEGAGAAAGGSQPRKTLLVHLEPAVALRGLADTLGKSGDVWEGVEKNVDGEIVGIDWGHKDLNGTLPVGNLGMPFLANLQLDGNSSLTGETTESC